MAKAAKGTLYDTLKADLFREHAFHAYGHNFVFWVYEDGTHSESMNLAVLEPLLNEAQGKRHPEDAQIMMHGFNDEDEMTRHHQRMAQNWEPYARGLAGMLLDEALKSRADPRMIVEVNYAPFSLEARAKLLRAGEHKIEEFFAQPVITVSHALTLNKLNTWRPIYALMKHDEKPGTAAISLHQERMEGRNPTEASFYAHASALTSMLGDENAAAQIADRYYTRATVMLNNEEGLLEAEEAKKRLSAFKWKMPRK